MSDPEETPAQAMDRLAKEISQLRRLRAQIPMMILEPYVEEASAHIREVAARMTVKATIPAAVAIAASREEQTAETQPAATAIVPGNLVTIGNRVYSQTAGGEAVLVTWMPTGHRESPEKWEAMILTKDGRLLTVPAEDLSPAAAAPAVAAATPAPKISPGARVKVKTTGKTGYVSEAAEQSAIVALDEGGFLTVPIADLEPLV